MTGVVNTSTSMVTVLQPWPERSKPTRRQTSTDVTPRMWPMLVRGWGLDDTTRSTTSFFFVSYCCTPWLRTLDNRRRFWVCLWFYPSSAGGFDALLVYQLGDAPIPEPEPTGDYMELGCAEDFEDPNRVRYNSRRRQAILFYVFEVEDKGRNGHPRRRARPTPVNASQRVSTSGWRSSVAELQHCC